MYIRIKGVFVDFICPAERKEDKNRKNPLEQVHRTYLFKIK